MQNKHLKKQDLKYVYQGAHFNEIVVKVNGSVTEINKVLLEKGIIGGFDLGRVISRT